jgi:hypothetical protein
LIRYYVDTHTGLKVVQINMELTKEQIRAAKELHRAVKRGEYSAPVRTGPLDCACVIHGNAYSWDYVEKLYNGLRRGFSSDIRMHVWTEHHRSVPPHMIKHIIDESAELAGPKRAWWYKLQMFNVEHYTGHLLYFDLDTVIVGDLSWMLQLNPAYFWTVRDFRYLWKTGYSAMNSSVMFWDTVRYKHLWTDFQKDWPRYVASYPGDQDYLNAVLPEDQKRFLETPRVKSWRWEVQDGGMDVRTRRYRREGLGAELDDKTSILVFHGRPKPHDVTDPVVVKHWV